MYDGVASAAVIAACKLALSIFSASSLPCKAVRALSNSDTEAFVLFTTASAAVTCDWRAAIVLLLMPAIVAGSFALVINVERAERALEIALVMASSLAWNAAFLPASPTASTLVLAAATSDGRFVDSALATAASAAVTFNSSSLGPAGALLAVV